MSDTPITDAIHARTSGGIYEENYIDALQTVRDMERELASLRAELALTTGTLESRERNIETLNATIADMEVRHAAAMLHAQTHADEYNELQSSFEDEVTKRERAEAERDAALKDAEEMEQRKDAAYLERNQVVSALSKCFPSGVARTAIEGWSDDWHGCVYIDLPTGQVSWHFHDSQAYLFGHLPAYRGAWDGHDTPEKYRRLAAIAARKGEQ